MHSLVWFDSPAANKMTVILGYTAERGLLSFAHRRESRCSRGFQKQPQYMAH